MGALGGDVTISAGNHYQQTGSHVVAPEGDIDISAKKVGIVAAQEASQSSQETKFQQSGLTVAVSAPVIAALQTMQQMKGAASQTGDARMKALAGATSALAAKNAADQVAADPKAAGGLSISITVGGSKSESKQTETSTQAASSTVAAGGNVSIRATGAGADSTLTVQGSDISAGQNAHLKADGAINLVAAENTSEMHRDSHSASGGVGVAVTVGSGGMGFGVTANASASRGKGEGTDTTWTNTHVSAGFSGSVNASQQKIDSDYASVTEQSGIKAGDGGFQVKVHGNTDLKGGVIESTQAAIDEKRNTFQTGTLTVSDIENRASYKASSASLGGGYASQDFSLVKGDGTPLNAPAGVGTNQQGQATSGGDKVPGTEQPAYNGLSTTAPVALAASGKEKSTTKSGISGADITITDTAQQQALTGKSAEQTIASLNRDVATEKDTSGALKPIFNEQEIQAGFEIVGALQRETGIFLNNRAKEADAKARLAHDPNAKDPETGQPLTDAQRQRYVEEAQALKDDWGPGGTYRQIATALTAAAGGNVTGSTADFATAGLVSYVQQQGAGFIGDLVARGELKEGSPEHAALHAILACGGAAAASQSCGAGAAGAAASSLVTNLFNDDASLSASDKEARSHLIGTLVAGIATTVDPASVATATSAATVATDNNYLKHAEIVERNKAAQACSAGSNADCKKRDALDALSKRRDADLAACEGNASAACEQLRSDVRNAYAEILRKGNTSDPLYGMEATDTRIQADKTLSFTDQAKGTASGLVDSVIDGAKGLAQLAIKLAENQALAERAMQGDAEAAAKLQARGESILDTARALADPDTYKQLSAQQRENLARAYESGDAEAIGHMQGELLGFLATLPSGGAALGTIKNVGKIEELAALGKAADKVAEAGAAAKIAMLGENGVQTASKTVWKGEGKARIDVENPNPGQRPGQIHYQDNEGKKYLYNTETKSFPGAPNSVNKLLNDPGFSSSIDKALRKYLGEKP